MEKILYRLMSESEYIHKFHQVDVRMNLTANEICQLVEAVEIYMSSVIDSPKR